MDDKELIAELGHVEVACCGEYWASGSHAVRLAAARLTALAEENERLKAALIAYRFAYTPDGHLKTDCFSTGPRTGDAYLDHVVCPGCVAQRLGDTALSEVPR